MKKYIINSNDAGQRVDKFIQKAAPSLPQSMMYKGIRTKNIKLNRKRCEISTRLSEGDVLELYLPDEFFGSDEKEYEFLKAPADITVVYEDENILLMDKKNGLVVHEDNDGSVDTLVNRMLHYLYAKGEYDPADENSFTPALCNRLDRNTGGIVIAAKNAESLRILNQKIKDRELEKKYLCILVGVPPKYRYRFRQKDCLQQDYNNKVPCAQDRRHSYPCGDRADDGQNSPDKGAYGIYRLPSAG